MVFRRLIAMIKFLITSEILAKTRKKIKLAKMKFSRASLAKG